MDLDDLLLQVITDNHKGKYYGQERTPPVGGGFNRLMRYRDLLKVWSAEKLLPEIGVM